LAAALVALARPGAAADVRGADPWQTPPAGGVPATPRYYAPAAPAAPGNTDPAGAASDLPVGAAPTPSAPPSRPGGPEPSGEPPK
jgi:hypothetical protein